jgi:hypothetical protein
MAFLVGGYSGQDAPSELDMGLRNQLKATDPKPPEPGV